MEAKLIIGGVAVMGLVFAALGAALMMSQVRFRRRAQVATGVITGLRPARGRRGGDPEPISQRGWYPTVRFTTANGTGIEAESRLATSPAPGLGGGQGDGSGQRVTVRYDPANPGRFTTAETAQTAGYVATAFVILGGLVFAVAAVLLLAVAG